MAVINGTSGKDDLIGTPDDDLINGLADDDALNGLSGNDTLDGGRALTGWWVDRGTIPSSSTMREISRRTRRPSQLASATPGGVAGNQSSQGAFAFDVFDLTVANRNHVPTVPNPIADRAVMEDQTFNFTVPANTFADTDPATP